MTSAVTSIICNLRPACGAREGGTGEGRQEPAWLQPPTNRCCHNGPHCQRRLARMHHPRARRRGRSIGAAVAVGRRRIHCDGQARRRAKSEAGRWLGKKKVVSLELGLGKDCACASVAAACSGISVVRKVRGTVCKRCRGRAAHGVGEGVTRRGPADGNSNDQDGVGLAIGVVAGSRSAKPIMHRGCAGVQLMGATAGWPVWDSGPPVQQAPAGARRRSKLAFESS